MKWVTWEHVGVDRMACAWLIRKFIDPQAEFVFVPAGQTPLPPDAEPFDIPGARLSHHRGHCTFHTMLREYSLDDPALRRIAQIVDGPAWFRRPSTCRPDSADLPGDSAHSPTITSYRKRAHLRRALRAGDEAMSISASSVAKHALWETIYKRRRLGAT
jgi:hypothetical protein